MHCWEQEGGALQHIELLSVLRESCMPHSALPCLNQEQAESHLPKNEGTKNARSRREPAAQRSCQVALQSSPPAAQRQVPPRGDTHRRNLESPWTRGDHVRWGQEPSVKPEARSRVWLGRTKPHKATQCHQAQATIPQLDSCRTGQ